MTIRVGDIEYRQVECSLTEERSWQRRCERQGGSQWFYITDPETEALLCVLTKERAACDRWRKDRGLNARSSEYRQDALAVEHDDRRAAEKGTG